VTGPEIGTGSGNVAGLDISRHPCFNAEARHTAGRVHLPIAPDCNIKCNYCNRDYDCVNESRPGVSSAILKPAQALRYLEQVMTAWPEITVVGLAGPGDPFADPAPTLETLALVRERFPELLLCVSTNGLNLEPHVERLREIGVSHVTITINAVAPEIGAQIYAWARYRKQVFRGEAAARVLLENQMAALKALRDTGIVVKVNTVLIPGVNEEHGAEVARVAAIYGANIFNCMPMFPVHGTPFGPLGSPSRGVVQTARATAGKFITQMSHCAHCRADAVGFLGEGHGADADELLERTAKWSPTPPQDRDCVAIATMEGVLVNEHLGRARSLAVYRQNGDGAFAFLEEREAPEPGGGPERWRLLAETLVDCRMILTSMAGAAPREALGREGIEVVEWTGLIADGLEILARGEIPVSFARRMPCRAGCSG
jgi:nitrogen fixation protein NifB